MPKTAISSDKVFKPVLPFAQASKARGLAFAFLVKTLARHAVTAWEGVGDTAAQPAAPTLVTTDAALVPAVIPPKRVAPG